MLQVQLRTFSALILVAILALLHGSIAVAENSKADAKELVDQAQISLRNFYYDPEMNRFRDSIGNAKGIYICPTLWQGGIGIGGSAGDGIFLIRDKDSGEWVGPAFYKTATVNLGLQLGASKSELVLLMMTQHGVNAALTTGMKYGVEASIAAGPVGSGAAIATTDILAFSRGNGIYGGLTVGGEMLSIDGSLNQSYYGVQVDAVDILIRKKVSNTHANGLRTELTNAAAR